MEQWLIQNWQWILLGFFIAEKIVKLTPFKWDDLLVDSVKSILKKMVGKR